MGTVATCDLELPSGLTGDQAWRMVAAVYDSVNTVFSTWQKDSELSGLNRAPADSAIQLSPWLTECMSEAQRIQEISGGTFSPNAEPLMRLWGFYRRQGYLPSPAEVDSARALLGRFKLSNQGQLTKNTPGMRFDLGGIAKGFAVDQAAEQLRAAGLKDGLIDLGGNLFCIGGAEGRNNWRVGVRDPLNREKYFATVEVTDLALATSGSYERFVTIDGRRYGHIMNPATGRPAEGVLGVTVLAESAQLADGLSTALFVAGPEEGRRIVESLQDNIEVIMVVPGPAENTGLVLVTPGLQEKVKILAEYEDRYQLGAW